MAKNGSILLAIDNDSDFLVDDTGNTRFWTVAVDAINYEHGLDMQQVWAQVVTWYESGEQWWLTAEEEGRLEHINKRHRGANTVREMLLDKYDFSRPADYRLLRYSASKFLESVGVEIPTNAQCKAAGAVLREMVGEPIKSNGLNKWPVPPLLDF